MKKKFVLRLAIITSITLMVLMTLAGNVFADEQFVGEGKIVGVKTSYQNGQHVCTVTVHSPDSPILQTDSFTITTSMASQAPSMDSTFNQLIRLSLCEMLLYAMELDQVEIQYIPDMGDAHVSLFALEIDGYHWDEPIHPAGVDAQDYSHLAGTVKTIRIWVPLEPTNTSVDTPTNMINRCDVRIKQNNVTGAQHIDFSLSDSLASHDACTALAKAFASREGVSVWKNTYGVQVGSAPLQMMQPSLMNRIREMF